jgi:hypothetical protein
MSAKGLIQTVLATKLIESVRKDIDNGIDPINLIANEGNGKIEDGYTAEFVRDTANKIWELMLKKDN